MLPELPREISTLSILCAQNLMDIHREWGKILSADFKHFWLQTFIHEGA